jgi:hypothetical protein
MSRTFILALWLLGLAACGSAGPTDCYTVGRSEGGRCQCYYSSPTGPLCRTSCPAGILETCPSAPMADAYEPHIRDFRARFGRTAEWEQWMLANRDRYEDAFYRARGRPRPLHLSFRYETVPIAYRPPWMSEAQHMTAFQNMANLAYPGFEFRLHFDDMFTTAYAHVVAGIASMTSSAPGNMLLLYRETIFAHEFGHTMGLLHHYDTLEEVGRGNHMPPGPAEMCTMDRNSLSLCSACRAALGMDLDMRIDEAALLTAMRQISDRYPY